MRGPSLCVYEQAYSLKNMRIPLDQQGFYR